MSEEKQNQSQLNSKEFVPWVEKYRPKKLSDVIGQPQIVLRLESYLKTGNFPHLLLAGRPGTGKTSAVLALAHQLYGSDIRECFKELNASDSRGIDTIRGQVKDFARTMPLTNVNFKILLLDEADALTDEAQQALRRTMEAYSANTRFVLSANYSSKIIEPIQSRCAVFRFRPFSDEDIKKIILRVIEGEGLSLDDPAINALVYVADGDARRAINALQGAATTTKKISEQDILSVASRARPEEVVKMLDLAFEGKFSLARGQLDSLLINYSMSGPDIISQIYRTVVKMQIPDEKKVLIVDKIGEYDYRMVEGADPRIQLEALLAQISLSAKKTA